MTGTKRFVFIIGERRNVYFEVTTREDDVFIIRNATWQLEKNGNVIAEGDCTIENTTTLIAEIEPPEIGDYLLTCTCEIGGQIIKEAVAINVARKRG